ncbi:MULTISPECIES: hypothetical protein [unclassified Borrelia]|uniref:hypothetical protein n=1 Tax=unclassified Borrelia TaxID=2649934 RepID=UPI001E37432B|nr:MULTISPECIES: hypothetical protein [unclassified Borrelia]UGQ16578.1 hypothetical protein LSO06_04495 [Borrelia sp. RT5S]UGQ17752.1 hypothetical protein LSO05_04810 [Borrelia sp. RT1S]
MIINSKRGQAVSLLVLFISISAFKLDLLINIGLIYIVTYVVVNIIYDSRNNIYIFKVDK